MARFDYVIVGGGSAGCVLANRLSEDPSVRVCLLESGPKELKKGRIPLLLHTLMGDPQRNWDRESSPQANLNNRRIYQPAGRGMGGGSGINSMIYIRGHRDDYDHWAALGNQGWSWDDVLPYFKKSQDHEDGSSDYHGSGGELSVSRLRHVETSTHTLLRSAQALGYPISDDFNTGVAEGFAAYQVTQVRGERCSASRAFIDSAIKRDNLEVITDAHASRILFDDQRRATGVAYRRDDQSATVHATREIILSAGAIGSPQLLMLSGIGPCDHLQALGIETIYDSPGVGENFQDHLDVGMSYHTRAGFGLGISPQFMPRAISGLFHYFFGDKRGVFASNVVEGGGFVRSSSQVKTPDIQLHFLSGNATNNGRTLKYGHSITLTACALRPNSRGVVRLTDNQAQTPPTIDPRFLSAPGDMETMVTGVKIVKRLLTNAAFAPYITGQRVPDFPLEDEEAIINHIRANAGTVYHPAGTCKMGSASDPMAVVMPDLTVRGVNGLRVADASIMPTIVSGNTNAPAIMIGEKASDMVKAV